MKNIITSFDKSNLLILGIYGFIVFFAIITLTKLLGNAFLSSKSTIFEFQDFLTSAIGFFLVLIVKIIEKFSNTNKT